MEAVVIGAGVSGLTTAVTLLKAGYQVRVLADRPPEETTSASAGASWSPYMVGHPRAMDWCEITRKTLEKLAASPATGVRIIGGIEASLTLVDVPEWARGLAGFRMCEPRELPAGYVIGWWGEVPVVDMPVYLRYLTGLLADGGVNVKVEHVSDLNVAPVVINCTGAGAGDLTGDAELVPTKGQLVVVRNPGIEHYFQDHLEAEDLTYFIPHGDVVVLGGCARRHDTSTGYNSQDADAILKRCARIDPRLATAEIVEHRTGVRPNRPTVRLEKEITARGNTVIHNYGHGGAGVTMSWGCAEHVLNLLG
ncbi:MAG TPA: FAD-dependent oxidoreductase [Candidatus Limnocylindrales bacterium]|nr:FAD-dependent oxidoreductase [Candidatus Limnocylindrales bacterium]